MNRKHTTNEYIEIINELIKNKPNIKFTSDFIIGYPGETESDFNLTLDLLQKVKFIGTYSFIFSPRPGTPAADLKQIDKDVAKKRLKDFQRISEKIKMEYRKSLLNTKVKVLFENRSSQKNKYFGRDEHFNPVIVESDHNLIGESRDVVIKKCNQNTMFGLVDLFRKSNNVAA